MSYKFAGTIKQLNDTMTFESGFKKREIIVTSDDSKYPQDVKFEFLKDDIDKLEGYKTGDLVELSFNVRGNEYQGKYYVSLTGWNIVYLNGTKPQEQMAAPSQPNDDDIPF